MAMLAAQSDQAIGGEEVHLEDRRLFEKVRELLPFAGPLLVPGKTSSGCIAVKGHLQPGYGCRLGWQTSDTGFEWITELIDAYLKNR